MFSRALRLELRMREENIDIINLRPWCVHTAMTKDINPKILFITAP